MRLEAGAIRELHWHTAAEVSKELLSWSYIQTNLAYSFSIPVGIRPQGTFFVVNLGFSL